MCHPDDSETIDYLFGNKKLHASPVIGWMMLSIADDVIRVEQIYFD